MNFLQEIRITASQNIQFTCHIISTNSSAPYGAEVLTYDPSISNLFSSLHPLGTYNDTQDAFKDIIDYCNNYSSAVSAVISSIDNPCNDPFIDKAQQQNIVNNKNINVTVLVNGK